MQAERVSPAQQGAEHGHAERAAGLPGGVQDAAGYARVLPARCAYHRCRHGRHGQRDQADQQRAGHDQRERRAGSRGGEQRRARRRQGEPGDHRRPRPEARGQPAAGQRAGPGEHTARQQQQPGGQHRLVPRLLQVEGQAEQRPVQRQVEDHPDAGGAAQLPGPEQRQRQERVRVVAFGADEERAGDQGRGEQRAGQRGEPALLPRGDEARGERGQHGHPEEQAGDVGPAAGVPR